MITTLDKPQQQQREQQQQAHASQPPPQPSAAAATPLERLVVQARPCILRPFCFFVSWQGVLVLAYTGFPPSLERLKGSLADCPGLSPEAPGSLWPKTTLAALRDGARLTPEQLATLMRICWECSGVFQAPGAPRAQAVLVDRCAVVVYEARSLERQLSKRVLPLTGCGGSSSSSSSSSGSSNDESVAAVAGERGGSSSGGGSGAKPPAVDTSEPSPAERARVDAVVRQADAPDYWVRAAADGHRESHYRGTALGATLVHELACFRDGSGGSDTSNGNGSNSSVAQAYGTALPGILRRFRARVEAALPGVNYAFFDQQSLHVTIRGLVP